MARNSVEILIRLRDEASAQLKRMQRDTSAAFRSLVGPSSVAATAVAGFGAAAQLAGLRAVHLAGQLEQSHIAFETLLGTAEAADAFLRDLADFAARTPFDFPGVQRATRLMLAFGFEAEQALPIVEALGDATSALGGSTAELEGVARAIGQIQTKGRLSQEELLQLAERGIPVFQILQEKLGLTGEQLGNIGALGIDAATGLTAILEGLSDRFAGAMERQSTTLLGLWSTVQDEISLTATDIGTKLIDALNLKDVLAVAIEQLGAFRDWVSQLDLRTVFDEGRDAIALMAGAIIATLLPSFIALAAQVARVIGPILAMAAAGALVVDVARQLGVDFGDLVKPSGVLARVASVATGLVDVFRGVSTAIANLILATSEGIRDWGEFFGLVVQQISDLFAHLAAMAAKSEQINQVLRERGPLGLPEALRLMGELDQMNRNVPVPNLAQAWNQAFQGTDEAILDGFDRANSYLTTGWQKIKDGFLGDVSDTVNVFVSDVTGAVEDAARKVVNWADLLGGGAAVPGVPGAGAGAGAGSSRSAAAAEREAAARQAAMRSAEVAGPGAGMDTGMSPGAIRHRLRAARERAEAEAQAVFDAYLAIVQDTSRVDAMAAAEVAGPGAGMDTGMSQGAIRYRLRAARARAEAEAQAVFDAYVAAMTSDERVAAMQAAEATGPSEGMASPLSQSQVSARLAAARARADREAAAAFDAYLAIVQDTSRVDAMAAAEVAGPGEGMSSPLSPGAIRHRLRAARERAEAEAQAVFDAYLAVVQDTSRLDAMAAAEVAGPGAGMDTGMSAGAIRFRLRQAQQRTAMRESEEAGAFRDDRWRPSDFTLSSREERDADAAANRQAVLDKERQAREELVEQLTTISADQGPLAMFRAGVLGLVRESLPVFDAALQGFAQGGPMGAVVAVFTQLLSESEAFQEFLTAINEALAPLIEIVGKIMTPIFKVLATVIRGVVDVLVSIWNFLFGWIPGMRVERSRPDTATGELERPEHSSEPPVTSGSLSFGGVGSAMQLGVAVPLREAGELHLTAAQTQLQATMMFAEYVTLLTERGFDVNLQNAAAASSPHDRIASLIVSRAAIVR